MVRKIKDTGRKWLVILSMLLVIIVLSGGALLWFDYLQIIDSGITQFVRSIIPIGAQNDAIDISNPLLLENERLAKREVVVERNREDLDRRERLLEYAETELVQRQEELLLLQEQLEQQEKSLISDRQQYDNQREVLTNNVRQLNAIPPADAAEILNGYNDQLIIDTFQVADSLAESESTVSLVPLWLSLLTPERAAAIMRKSVIKLSDQ